MFNWVDLHGPVPTEPPRSIWHAKPRPISLSPSPWQVFSVASENTTRYSFGSPPSFLPGLLLAPLPPSLLALKTFTIWLHLLFWPYFLPLFLTLFSSKYIHDLFSESFYVLVFAPVLTGIPSLLRLLGKIQDTRLNLNFRLTMLVSSGFYCLLEIQIQLGILFYC